ncbi:TonB family protein [Pedobacter sp. MR2016-19]|uniref:Energy transducer TonB n=1 Tax=Pedobacter alluvionis TaxID=475253 RepID=A0A497Y6D5_9SPHI|nr:MULTISPECIES: energy transducer TonB [Pedobacter]MBE5319657.1 TonB family protein [Pedobacter sp. MR2016-19]RLJ77536.1 outer membrane transport energization protein TonB [Pedobacter alluvionis]TFB33251.1 energy transducer TonB [Pedobacter alluvionis]
MSKLDIFRKEWLEVVFADKNKNYGAYQLRKSNGANTTKALIIGSIIFLVLFFSPKIYSLIKGSMDQQEDQVKAQEVILAPPPPVNPETPPPPPVEPPPPKIDQVKMPPPIVKPDIEVRDEPPTVEKLKEADPGQRDIKGDPTADIVIAEPVGEGPKREAAVAVDDNKVYDFVSIEKQPEFPGGIAKFYGYLGKAIKYPPMAQENNVQGKVFLSFVVEKDGKLTDITVTRGLGSGTDEEAIRVLKASPRWNPGIQNGKPVRVKYNINVNFTLN